MYHTQTFDGTEVCDRVSLRSEVCKYYPKTGKFDIVCFADKYKLLEHDESRNLLIYKQVGDTYRSGLGESSYSQPTIIVAKILKVDKAENVITFEAKQIWEVKYGQGFLKQAKQLLKEFLNNQVQFQKIGEFEIKFDGRYFQKSTIEKKNEVLKVNCIQYIQTQKVFFEVDMPDEIYELISNNWFDIDESTRKCVIINDVTDILEKTIKAESVQQLEEKLRKIYERANLIKILLGNGEKFSEDNLYIGFSFEANTEDVTSVFENRIKLSNKHFIQFTFFKTYKISTDNFIGKHVRYYAFDLMKGSLGDEIKHFAIANDDFEKTYKIIKWTKEREEFFKKIEKDLIDLNSRIAFVTQDLDEEKIDKLISSTTNLLTMGE